MFDSSVSLCICYVAFTVRDLFNIIYIYILVDIYFLLYCVLLCCMDSVVQEWAGPCRAIYSIIWLYDNFIWFYCVVLYKCYIALYCVIWCCIKCLYIVLYIVLCMVLYMFVIVFYMWLYMVLYMVYVLYMFVVVSCCL